MPMLDVSFVLHDPMFEDEFQLRRRLDVVLDNGRTQPMLDRVTTEYGVVLHQDPADLIKTEEGQTIPRRIFVACQTLLIAEAPGQQGDEITWNGERFIVTSSLTYSRFGEGFYEGIAEYRDTVPPVQ